MVLTTVKMPSLERGSITVGRIEMDHVRTIAIYETI